MWRDFNGLVDQCRGSCARAGNTPRRQPGSSATGVAPPSSGAIWTEIEPRNSLGYYTHLPLTRM